MEQKLAITNPDKWDRILAEARKIGPERYNLVLILFGSGMHIQVYATPSRFKAQFNGETLMWQRPKTYKWVSLSVQNVWSRDPRDLSRELVEWLQGKHGRRTRQCYDNWLRKIGKRSGVSPLSAMNFRHTFCYRRLLETGGNIPQVQAEMKASRNVIDRNYSLLPTGNMSGGQGIIYAK